MTDNEIMVTLRRCADKACYRCSEYGKEYCRQTIASLAWDLMYNQKAEIEGLKEKNEKQRLIIEAIDDNMFPLPFETDYDKAIKNAKAEAIKEFAERLKQKRTQIQITYNIEYDVVFVTEIDPLVKELLGDFENE